MVCEILWHILLTILFKLYAKGIEFSANRSRSKIDVSVTTIDRNTAVVEDGAAAAAYAVAMGVTADTATLDAVVDAPVMVVMVAEIAEVSVTNVADVAIVRDNDMTDLELAANFWNGVTKGNKPLMILQLLLHRLLS